MRKSIKAKICVLASLFISLFAFCESSKWFVCMGSFKNLEKANERVQILQNNGFSTFLSEFQKSNSEKYYRVLFSQNFNDKKTANDKKNELIKNSKIKELKLSDLWCLESTEDNVQNQNPIKNQKVDEKQTIVISINGTQKQVFEVNKAESKIIKINIDLEKNQETGLVESVTVSNSENEENPIDSNVQNQDIESDSLKIEENVVENSNIEEKNFPESETIENINDDNNVEVIDEISNIQDENNEIVINESSTVVQENVENETVIEEISAEDSKNEETLTDDISELPEVEDFSSAK